MKQLTFLLLAVSMNFLVAKRLTLREQKNL